MAKRNKAKFASKSRKSALRVEALEQRQLLAAVTGGGTEVGSNIVHPNGNVYDQVLMTGSSVTVTADAGQVTRVSFLDLQGDIVQAEFAGKGSLTISLDQFSAAAPAANYNQPGVNYVKGLATFTIQGEDASTNFNVFSVGSNNAVNQNLFAGGKTGGNNTADVARLLIVADPLNPGGFSTMGGIRAGNAVFSDSSGVVGISAASVNVQGPVVIGDIDASNAGVPTLNFGTGSQFATLTVSGGDLAQTNAAKITNAGFSNVNSVDGTSSAGTTLRAQTVSGASFNTAVTTVTLDTTTAFDLTGKTQADIDAAFKNRTFTNDVTINGDLSSVNSLTATEFRGAVTFTGTLTGDVTVTGGVKSITLQKSNADKITAGTIGSITTTGTANLAGTVTSTSIGSITVGGNLSAAVSTDYYGTGATVPGTTVLGATGAWDLGEKSVGDVNVTGNFTGSVYGVLGVGNVTVGGNLTSTGTALKTSSGTTGDAFVGNIGKITVTGDVSQGAGALISIAGNGTFGDITVGGAGTDTGSHTVGSITVAGSLGGAGTTAGKITVTDSVNATNTLTLGNISIGSSTSANGSLGAISITANAGNVATGTIGFTGTGSVGDVTVTGSGAKNATASLGAITLSSGGTGTVSLGNISVTNAEVVTTGAISAKSVGNVNVKSVNAGGSVISVTTGAITATAGTGATTIGNVNLDATSTGTVSIGLGGTNPGADISTSGNTASNGSTSIGTVTVNAGTIAFNSSVISSSVGAVSLTGNTTFANGKGIQALKGLTSFTAVGDTTFNATGSANIKVGGTTGANFSFTGTTTFSNSTNPSILADNGGSGLDALGNLTFNGKVVGAGAGVEVRASSIGDITITGALATNESLVKNFNVYAGNTGNAGSGSKAETVKIDGSNLSSYSIGNVTIQSTNSIGIAGTALLEGTNSINAIGKIGNVSLVAGGSSAVQSTLFHLNTTTSLYDSSLVVQTGNGNIAANTVNTVSSGIDFDGDGGVGTLGTASGFDTTISVTNENSSQFSTASSVSIGNITVNAKLATGSTDTVAGLGGDPGTASDGLSVLSGTKGNGSVIKPTVVGAISGNLRGTIGNVSVTNLSQQLSVQGPYGTPTGAGNVDKAGLIAATAGGSTASPYGTIQGIAATTAGLTAANNTVLIGNDGTANDASSDTLVVIRL